MPTSIPAKRTASKRGGPTDPSIEVPKLIKSIVRVEGMEQPLLVSMPAHLPTLQGVLNQPNPRCLRGRESVIEHLQHAGKEPPLDDDHFFLYGVSRHNRSSHASLPSHTSRRASHLNMFSDNLNINRVRANNQQQEMRTQLVQSNNQWLTTIFSSLACNQIQTKLFHQQCLALKDPSEPSESSFSTTSEVVTNVLKAQHAQKAAQKNFLEAGMMTKAMQAEHDGSHSVEEKDNHRFYQMSYMRMLSEKYESIRLWKHVTGRVQVKFKKSARQKAKYLDLYPASEYLPYPTTQSEWYKGASLRGRLPAAENSCGVHTSRLKSVVDMEWIEAGLEKDPWMFDDLVYIFVCGDIYNDNQSFGNGFISIPPLPPHFMEDESSPLVQSGTPMAVPQRSRLSGFHRKGHEQQQQARYSARGSHTPLAAAKGSARICMKNTNVSGKGKMEKNFGYLGNSNDYHDTKNTQSSDRNMRPSDRTKAQRRKQPNRGSSSNSSSSIRSGKRSDEKKTESSGGMSKYTTALFNLPEIMMISSNEAKVEGNKTGKEEETKWESDDDEEDDDTLNGNECDALDTKNPKNGNGFQHNEIGVSHDRPPFTPSLFTSFDDAASEESLFREIAAVVERRGDLSGSSVCNSGDSRPPSLADAPSSISPHVQYETTGLRYNYNETCETPWGSHTSADEMGLELSSQGSGKGVVVPPLLLWGDKDSYEVDQQSHDENPSDFFRHDIWSPREESKLTSFPVFGQRSIWRTDDSLFFSKPA